MIPNRYNISLHCNFQIPKGCNSLHHEVELGIVIEQAGKNISESSALEHVGGYVLALDMTARDFQDEAKKKGHPWTMAKGFDTSCPVSSFIPREEVPDPHNINLWLKVGSLCVCVCWGGGGGGCVYVSKSPLYCKKVGAPVLRFTTG